MEEAKQDYRGLYEQIVKSEWFKKAYHNKSLGECPIVVEELEESEDERIRKWLIKTLKGLCNSPVEIDGSYEMMLPAIAWLEKQKDADKAILAVDKIDRYIDLLTANAHDMKDSNPDKKYYRGWDDALGKISGILQDVYSGEKQKEQKPHRVAVDTCEAIDKVREFDEQMEKEQNPVITHGELYHTDTIGTQQVIAGKTPQKPAEWSEEDKENLLCVCGLLKHYLSADYKGSKYWDDAQVNEWIEWTKNLPNRFQLQHKQEWSEEDEKVYEYLKGGFEYATNNPELLSSRLSGKNDATVQDYKNFIDKLKSLRPQPKQELSEGDRKILDNVSQILIGLNYQELAKNYKQTIEKLWKSSKR